MVTFEREFHRHKHGGGIEDPFCLARNNVTGNVFVRQKWAKDTAAKIDKGSCDLSIVISSVARENGKRPCSM